MKRIGVVGLCFITIVVASSSVPASAHAERPSFETEGSFPVTFTSVSLLPLLPTLTSNITGVNVLCLMAGSDGEIETSITLAKILVLYSGCKIQNSAAACTTAGRQAGTILTTLIVGETGYLEGKARAGILFKPEAGNSFAAFKCGALITVNVGNSVIGEELHFKSGKKEFFGEWHFEGNATNTGQRWPSFVGGPICELTINTSSRGWLMDTEWIVYDKVVEFK